MPNGTEAPATTTAEGPTQHTQNQGHPSVYELMALVMRDVRNVGKDGFNEHQKYRFRGVDGAIGALAQPLRDHGVFMTPEVLDCESEVRGKMNAVRMRVAFHFYGPAGDRVTAVTMGEASDTSDKASNKAMSAALKYALIHTFMIPVDENSLDDGDRDHPVGQRSPADGYVERLRKPAVWNSVNALAAMHGEAKADGLLNATVEGPNGETTLGELITGRGGQLKAELAEREARKAEEGPKAAAQVAAEHGVPPQAEPEHSKPAEQQPAVDSQAMVLEDFKAKVTRGWDSLDATRQNLLEAKAKALVDTVVPAGPDGKTPTRIGDLLWDRITELETAKRQHEGSNA